MGRRPTIEAGGHEFVADVVPCEPSVYDRVRSDHVERIVTLLDPIAVYEYGRIGVPGISDIDLLIVADPERPPPEGGLGSLPFWEEYLIDKPIVFSPELFRDLYHLVYIDSVTHVWGEHCPIDAPADEERRILDAAILADFGQMLLHRLLKAGATRKVSTRTALLQLNSVRHSMALASRAGVDVPIRAETYASDVEALRTRWLTEPDYEGIVSLLADATEVVEALLCALAETACRKDWWRAPSDVRRPIQMQVGPTSFSIYRPLEARDSASSAPMRGFRGPTFSAGRSSFNLSLTVASLPLFLHRHLLACAAETNPISRTIARLCPRATATAGELSASYRTTVSHRMALGGRHWTFLNSRRLLGLGQFPPYGLTSELVSPDGSTKSALKHAGTVFLARLARLAFRATSLARARGSE